MQWYDDSQISFEDPRYIKIPLKEEYLYGMSSFLLPLNR